MKGTAMFFLRQIGIAVLTLVWSVSAQAESDWRVFGHGIVTLGGETVYDAPLENGGTRKIKAGQFFNIAAGVQYKVTPNWSASASLGWQYATSTGTNGSAHFSRYPVELLLGYEINPHFRINGGVRKALNAHGEVKGAASPLGSGNFDPSLGLVFETEWQFEDAKKTIIFARLVKEAFTKKSSGEKYDGSHIGIGAKFYF